MLCEICKGAFEEGKRAFDEIVQGTERREFRAVDLYSLVGEYASHTITVEIRSPEFAIDVMLKKSEVRNQFMSDTVVGTVGNLVKPPERPTIPESDVAVSQQQNDGCICSIDAYIAEKEPTSNSMHQVIRLSAWFSHSMDSHSISITIGKYSITSSAYEEE